MTAPRTHVHARHVARTSAPAAGVQLAPPADTWPWSPATAELAHRLARDLVDLAELAKREVCAIMGLGDGCPFCARPAVGRQQP